MTDKKKSFLLYLDTLEILHKLTDEQAGKLLKAFLAYHSEHDVDLDPTLDLVFFSFQAQFERDLVKYKNIVERNKNNGSKGGRPKNPVKAKEPSGLSGNPSEPKKADSVSGSDKDSVSESDNKNIVVIDDRFNEFWNLYEKKTGKPKCEALWKKLSQEIIDLIFTNLPAYISAKPDKQFRKDPERWLKHECWNDEVIINERNNNENLTSASRKESSHERIKRENAIKYGGQDERGLCVAGTDRHLGRAMGEGERDGAIEYVDRGTFIDYEQSS